MNVKVDEIKKRMKKRRQERSVQIKHYQKEAKINLPEDEERYGFERFPTYDNFNDFDKGKTYEPRTYNGKSIITKALIAACLFLLVAISFQSNSPQLQKAQSYINDIFTEPFQFATVANWYESQFGKPLALLPAKKPEHIDTGESIVVDYAIPASGTVIETFETNGQGITIETMANSDIEVINEGIVRFAGVDPEHGKTVIIQHANKTETWYGNLNEINVNLFDFVEKGKPVGTVAATSDGEKGSLYFAIKQGGDFINPVQVIEFE